MLWSSVRKTKNFQKKIKIFFGPNSAPDIFYFHFIFFLQVENFAFFPFSYMARSASSPSPSLLLGLPPSLPPSSLLSKKLSSPISLPVFPREKASYEYEIGERRLGSKSGRGDSPAKVFRGLSFFWRGIRFSPGPPRSPKFPSLLLY